LTLLDYQGALATLLLGLFALATLPDWRARLSFAGAALVPLGALLVFQRVAFGSVWHAPFHDLEDEHLRAHHAHGFFGFGWPQRTALSALLFDGTVGFFGLSPFLWLAVAGAIAAFRAREVRWAAAFVVALVIGVAGIANWRGGWAIGPRYLVTAMPFAVFVAVAGLDRLAQRGPRARAIARGVAGGALIASSASAGIIGILINTLPYDIASPLRQVVIPYLRAGFVPHHAGELVGLAGPPFFYALVVLLLLAATVAALAQARDAWPRWPVAVAALLLALLPSLAFRARECPAGVRRLTEIWEPAGLDNIAALRMAAHTNPCLWRRVAALEAGVCWSGAADDARRAIGNDCR
jgi:hypothetical protein